MSLRRALFVALIVNAVAASPALPQLLGERVEANCSFAAEATSTTALGFSAACRPGTSRDW